METVYLTYRKYYTEADLEELKPVLNLNNIPFLIEHEKDLLDSVYVGKSLDPMVALKIRQQDFNKVNEILEDQSDISLDSIDSNYYLFQFTDAELIDVVHHPEEWNYLDRTLAKKLLAERQVAIPEAGLEAIVKPYEPTALKPWVLMLEWAATILLDFVGLLLGVATLVASKTLSNGDRVMIFDENARQHAKWMFVVSIIRMIVVHFIIDSI